MIGLIALFAGKVLRQIFLESKFVAAALLVVVLFTISSLLGATHHRQMLEKYQGHLALAQEKSDLEGILVAKAPHPLDFVSASAWDSLPQMLRVSPLGIEAVALEEFKGSFLRGIEALDLVHVIAVMLSLLAIFISYDAVCGEREDGTLSLILSFPVRRSVFLIGTWLGLMVILLLPLLVGLVISLLIVHLSPAYELGAMQFFSISLVGAAAVLYLALFALLSLLISSLCRQPSTALIWLILLWVVLIVVIPGNGSFLAELMEPTPQHVDEMLQVDQIRQNYQPDLYDYFQRVQEIVDGGSDEIMIDYNLELLRDEIVAEQRASIAERDRLIVAVHDEFARRRQRQITLSRWTTIASPAVLYRDLIERLLTTGPYHHRRFQMAARDYLRALEEPLRIGRKRHAEEAPEKALWSVIYQGFSITAAPERDYRGIKPDRDLFPPFTCRLPGPMEALASALWEMLALVAICAALFLGTVWTFARYDVR